MNTASKNRLQRIILWAILCSLILLKVLSPHYMQTMLKSVTPIILILSFICCVDIWNTFIKNITYLRNKIIIIGIVSPLVLVKLLFILNDKLSPIIGGYSMGLFGNGRSVWFTIIPVSVGICGLFYTLIMVPVLWKVSFHNWKKGDVSWKWQLALVPIVFIIGSYLNWPLSILMFITIPLGILVFTIMIINTLINAKRYAAHSAFYNASIFLLIIPLAGWLLLVLINGDIRM